MMYVKYPLSLRNVEDLLAERGIDISHETVRFWWNRFGPMFAAEIRKKRVAHMRRYPQWRWHLDEVFVKVNGKPCSGFEARRRCKNSAQFMLKSTTISIRSAISSIARSTNNGEPARWPIGALSRLNDCLGPATLRHAQMTCR